MIFPTIELESKLWEEGYTCVCGIDEVGRGPLAGPVVVGAVCISNDKQVLDGVRDSKTMTEKRRLYFFEKIKEISTAWGVGIVESVEIDTIGLAPAIQKAMSLALNSLEEEIGNKADYLLVDGGIAKLPDYEMLSVNGGDNIHYSISAASVIAKVTRDQIMQDYAEKYPLYGFEKHVGYGTKAHMEFLEKYGPCPIHRKSFKPVAKFFE